MANTDLLFTVTDMDDDDVQWRDEHLAREVRYFTERLADPSILDHAVTIDNVVDSSSSVDGVPVKSRCLPAYCVPALGTRKGGGIDNVHDPAARQHIIATLRDQPGFPDLRAYEKDGYAGVLWGDDGPPNPDPADPFAYYHFGWLRGQHYGYSLDATVTYLGRLVAIRFVGMAELLALEREVNGSRRRRRATP